MEDREDWRSGPNRNIARGCSTCTPLSKLVARSSALATLSGGDWRRLSPRSRVAGWWLASADLSAIRRPPRPERQSNCVLGGGSQTRNGTKSPERETITERPEWGRLHQINAKNCSIRKDFFHGPRVISSLGLIHLPPSAGDPSKRIESLIV